MLLADNSWLFRVTGAPHLAVGPSLLRALWHGMRCLTMSEIHRWDATHFNVSSRHFCSRSTSFPSALEVFYDYALYKFTIDIDIDIDRSSRLADVNIVLCLFCWQWTLFLNISSKICLHLIHMMVLPRSLTVNHDVVIYCVY